MTTLTHLEELSRKGTAKPWVVAQDEHRGYVDAKDRTVCYSSAQRGLVPTDLNLIEALRNSCDDLFAAIRAADAWHEASLKSSKRVAGRYPSHHTVISAREAYRIARANLGGSDDE